MRRGACLLAVAASLASAEPGRNLRYAESADRMVYAFVSGHLDTCRVYRRITTPMLPLEDYLRRPPGQDHRGEPGAKLLKEIVFGRLGRPLHLYPTNDGRFLLALGNRRPDGRNPTRDRVHHLGEDEYSEVIDYAALAVEPEPAWPVLERALAAARPEPARPAEPWSYAYLDAELAPGRVLIGRQSEGPGGARMEFRVFVIEVVGARALLPAPAELRQLLHEEEPLWRAAAAWVMGRRRRAQDAPLLADLLTRTKGGAQRATTAHALVSCGDESGRRVLRALLAAEDDVAGTRSAVRALLALPPDRGDAEALGVALASKDSGTTRWAGMALARLGAGAVPVLNRLARSADRERRLAVVAALGYTDDVLAEERLLMLVRDRDKEVSTAAAVSLTDPPRKLYEANHALFARALDACRRAKNDRAARRLCVLAAHARVENRRVYKALVDLAPSQPKAIWALAKLTGEPLKTPDDCRAWWKSQR